MNSSRPVRMRSFTTTMTNGMRPPVLSTTWPRIGGNSPIDRYANWTEV